MNNIKLNRLILIVKQILERAHESNNHEEALRMGNLLCILKDAYIQELEREVTALKLKAKFNKVS